jgi:hypothetical protein
MARPKRFELLTPRFVVWCSIQLSYGRFLRLPMCLRGPHIGHRGRLSKREIADPGAAAMPKWAHTERPLQALATAASSTVAETPSIGGRERLVTPDARSVPAVPSGRQPASQGKLAAAEEVHLRLLAAQPDHFDARHFLSVLQHQQGRSSEALASIGAALKTNPRFSARPFELRGGGARDRPPGRGARRP